MKVNVLVDVGVAPLVEALNTLPGIITLDSCQGGYPKGPRRARVAFSYLQHDGDLYKLTVMISKLIREQMQDAEGVSLTLEWWHGGEGPLAWLRCPLDKVGQLASAIEVKAKPDPR